MAASDAIPVPRKNTAFRFYFAVRKPSDATLITSWTGADSEVSLDGAAFSDCTNEATEIGTTGCGYIDLTSSEMNADAVVVKITFTNTGAVPLVFTFFPESAGDYRVADTQKVDVNTIKTNPVVNGGTITFPTDATVASTTNITAGTITTATNVTTVNGLAANVITAASIAADAITDAKVAADVTIASVTGSVGSVAGNVGGNVTGSVGSVVGLTASNLDVASSTLATAANLAIVAGYLDTEIAAIKAKTDNLPSDPADQSSVEAAITSATSGLATASALSTVGTNVSTAVTQTTASSIRSAVGLATANLDTQLAAIPTTIRMKKNAALSGFQIVMIDSGTEQPATGATVTGAVSKDGAAFGSLTNSVTEIGSGAYTVDLAAADTNGNNLLYKFAATGCKTLFVKVVTQL